MRRGDLAQSARVFSYLIEREPDECTRDIQFGAGFRSPGTPRRIGRVTERLAQIEPVGPFHYFNLGLAAMEQQDFRRARDLFAEEVARAGYNAEFHYWLALANFKLGDIEPARKHLTLALENGVTRNDRELYAAKLAWLQTHGVQ